MRWKGLKESALAHSQRAIDVFVDVIRERKTRYELDDMTGKGRSVIGIGDEFPGHSDSRRNIFGEKLAQGDY